LTDCVVCLDIGTSFIRAVFGEYNENDALQISGIGTCASAGVRNGQLVNIEDAIKAIKEAVGEAEMVSCFEAGSCAVAIGGGAQIAGINSKGLVALTAGEKGMREITAHDQNRVIETAKTIPISPDRHILHVVPQSYIVDGTRRTKKPVNEMGVRLEAEVHIITAGIDQLQAIQRCVQRAGYGPAAEGIMLKTLAATHSVMNSEEIDLGSILIDLGGGTTDVLVLNDGAPISTFSIPVGGTEVTRDIALEKSIPRETAEQIKISSGACWESVVEDQSDVIIPSVGWRPPETISRLELCAIIRARVEEILRAVRREAIRLAKVDNLAGNIVLVGGGAQMPGILDLTKEVFLTDAVRIGYPCNLGDLADDYRTPEWAVATGLLMSTMEKRRRGVQTGQPRGKPLNVVFDFLREFF
jgi:cell division protein FtsA